MYTLLSFATFNILLYHTDVLILILYEFCLDIFHSERLTIVVTHFDKFFDSKKGQISKTDIKHIVAKTIQDVIDVEVSENIIFPVAGKWACLVSE